MKLGGSIRVVGLLSIGFSLTMLPPVAVSLWYHDNQAVHFLTSFAIAFTSSLMVWLLAGNHKAALRRKDGFAVVVLFWIALSLLSALPFLLGPHLDFVDAFFEAVSGFTTTGATVIPHLDDLPRSILYYRQQLQWLGGMGLVVLAVAVLPLLGIGGMRIYRAETPGPMKDEKIAPRLTQSARALWIIYVLLTVACALAYWLAGMTPFDAIGHAFSTISTGGFSTHDASLGYFHSESIESIATLFLPVFLIFISFIGGCGGSTSGGMKVMRILLLFKQGLREVDSLIHPHLIRPVKIGGRVLQQRTIEAVWGFFAVYILVFVVLTLAMMATGLDQVSAYSAVATSLNNLGPGLGAVAYNFAGIDPLAKLISVFAMLMGRLEIFTILVFFTPSFWLD